MASDSSLSVSLEGVREWLRKSINGEKWKNHLSDGECSEISSSYQESWSEGSVSELEEPGDATFSRDWHKNNSNTNQIVHDRPCRTSNQDKNKPFYVPRKPHFFEHDLRILDDEDVVDTNRKYRAKEEDHDSWSHDLFNSELQKPKSKQEIIDCYGYDIRCDSPSFMRSKTKGRRSNQFEHHDHSYKFKQRTNDASDVPSSLRQQEEYPSALSKNTFDLEAKIDDLTIEKSKESTDHKTPPFSKSYNKSEPKSTVNRVQNTSPTMYTLIKEGSDNASASSSIISSNPTFKVKDRPSGALPAKFTGNIGQSKLVDVNRAKLTNNIPILNNHEADSSIARGRGQNRNTCLSRGAENKNSTANVPLRKDLGESYTVTKVENISRNYQSSVLPSNCQNVINMKSEIRSNENVTSPTQSLLNTDVMFPDSKAVSRTCTGGTVPPDYRYYSDYMYGVNGGDNFIFPAPPDLSVSHLTPYIPQHQYYFTNSHPHQNIEQGYDSPLQWCYYTQSSCYQGTATGITYLKQHNVNNWPNSLQVGHLNQLVPSQQPLDVNPYYSLHNEGNLENEERNTDAVTSSAQRTIATKSVHRYSVIRSKLHLIHSSKVSK